MNQLELERFRTLLVKRRGELTDIVNSARQAAQIVVLDQTRVGRLSRMDALQQQAMSQESNRRRQMELSRILGALSRINDREYGYCVDCGDDIASNRLEIDPTATRCIGCANRLESDPTR
jgi:DnaK suppressor protein